MENNKKKEYLQYGKRERKEKYRPQVYLNQ